MGTESDTELPEDRRKAIFADLVNTQDSGLTVPASREAVAARHGVSVEVVRTIEREGLENDWLA